jgi:hypothetical protein
LISSLIAGINDAGNVSLVRCRAFFAQSFPIFSSSTGRLNACLWLDVLRKARIMRDL